MKTIFILMDSLNRHYLECYQKTETFNKMEPYATAITPNINRLSENGITFDNHWCASMPCMPARRDMTNGRYNFLETPWGALEPYDEVLGDQLRESKVYSHLITDHYHYFEWFGQGYHTQFDSWEFIRGQEGDFCRAQVKDPEIPKFKGKNRRQDWINRQHMDLENDLSYPTPQCFQKAMDFLDVNHTEDDWFLQLEVFDPHEPFICPSKYRNMYPGKWTKDFLYDWPNYQAINPEFDDEESFQHIRAQYMGTLTMADTWLGKLLDKIEALGAQDDIRIVLTTDHGHLLGEHGFWAKNHMFDYRELANTPMIMAGKGIEKGTRRKALTSNIDLAPTFLTWHDSKAFQHAHGKCLDPLLAKDSKHHETVLYGYFAKDMNITDGQITYTRQALKDSSCKHHTSTPVHYRREKFKAMVETTETGSFLPHVNIPVYRFDCPSQFSRFAPDFNLLYDLGKPQEHEFSMHGTDREVEWEKVLSAKLVEVNAPKCQWDRLNLKK